MPDIILYNNASERNTWIELQLENEAIPAASSIKADAADGNLDK